MPQEGRLTANAAKSEKKQVERERLSAREKSKRAEIAFCDLPRTAFSN